MHLGNSGYHNRGPGPGGLGAPYPDLRVQEGVDRTGGVGGLAMRPQDDRHKVLLSRFETVQAKHAAFRLSIQQQKRLLLPPISSSLLSTERLGSGGGGVVSYTPLPPSPLHSGEVDTTGSTNITHPNSLITPSKIGDLTMSN